MDIHEEEEMISKGIRGVPESPDELKTKNRNRKRIKMLYKAFSHGETEIVSKLVASDLEWWYHGPPNCQYMMKMLTGEATYTSFKFRPRRMRAIGERVIVEGWEGLEIYWVHVWNIKEDGIIITQFREYFNTLLTVLLGVSENGGELRLWQSATEARICRSLPDLVLAA
ncbi:wound-induced protein 1-like [Quillaja saponaria]|uniref:Wound-induced protein 1-like n=1 Tax=Quillaja saponaria TaxID=32244 RepID=A0AAD7LUG2_QUISA|nr:wound-induced protein 1-like [Quillaja saponaria]